KMICIKKDRNNRKKDLILKFEKDNKIYLLSLNIIKIKKEEKDLNLNISFTYEDSNFMQLSILNLKKSYEDLKNMIPVMMPRYICFARIIDDSFKSLNDILILDTIKVIDFFEKEKISTNLNLDLEKLKELNLIYKYNKFDNLKKNYILENSDILYASRENNYEEIKQMEDFIIELEENSFAKYIESLFYNSKKACCTIEIYDNISLEIQNYLKILASKYIKKFIFTNCEEIVLVNC
ncbi:hypothetical protein, partial [Malaciobacter mytili]|uniref:hypothetical protein n=1 Tax=Malaciobacter mytili TaxID=603050 RepID=UPI0013E98B04